MDDGESWCEPQNWTQQVKQEPWYLFAPAPGNGITMRDGNLLMPSQGRGAEGFPFSNITWSKDHGKTWPDDHHVLLDSGRGNGYSSLVMVDQQTIGILYESSVASLVFPKIPLADFVE